METLGWRRMEIDRKGKTLQVLCLKVNWNVCLCLKTIEGGKSASSIQVNANEIGEIKRNHSLTLIPSLPPSLPPLKSFLLYLFFWSWLSFELYCFFVLTSLQIETEEIESRSIWFAKPRATFLKKYVSQYHLGKLQISSGRFMVKSNQFAT